MKTQAKSNISIQKKKKTGKLHLDKWFLDFVGESGETMIFYAAKLWWRGIKIPYTSWIHYQKNGKISVKSRYSKPFFPQNNGSDIRWTDPEFGVSGKWQGIASPLMARLFESDEGNLDWNCFQPVSKVRLKINNKVIEGIGYVEQLILTTDPWKIPMDQLRWGRFGTKNNNLVWIELKQNKKQQWVWFNGMKVNDIIITDNKIVLPGIEVHLLLDQSGELESEKKIEKLMKNLVRYIPGFGKSMPFQFLMADEQKWRSRGVLYKNEKIVDEGWAIHELVDFNPESHDPPC